MAIAEKTNAFVDAVSTPIDLSQMFAVTTGVTNPAYLVLTVLDRDEYTAGASHATGTLTGNGQTLSLSSLSGDGRGAGIVFTYNQWGQYYNSTYGYLDQLVFNSSASTGDVTNLSLFGTNSLSFAKNNASDAYKMMQFDPAGYLGSATVVTQPNFTGTVPPQATPDSIAAVANSFVNQVWNGTGCWVLASTIAADAGASLPVQSTDVGLSGQSNGEWFVAFNGPTASKNSPWQAMVTVGDIVVIGKGTDAHITTCVSGTGSTAELVDNLIYVNPDGTYQNAAHDSSPNDIIVQPPHLASLEWSGVATSSVVIYRLDTPVVIDRVTSCSATCGAALSLASLFGAADPASKSITQWQVYETDDIGNDNGTLVVNGTDYSDHTEAAALTTSSLASVSLLAGSTATADTLEVRAFNGTYWGDWTSLAVTVTGAETPSPPVVAVQTANQSWLVAQPVALTLPPSTFTDPQAQALTYKATLSGGAALPGWLTFNTTTQTFTGTAPNTPQNYAITVTATDTSGLSASETIAVAVVGAPFVAASTSNQLWVEGRTVSLALPPATFADPQGQALSYTATLAGGAALPGWLTFSTTTETFTGTAPLTATVLHIDVIATDTSGLSTHDTFTATVAAPPAIVTQTPDQSWIGGQAYTFVLPTATFTDPQGLLLNYTATTNGQPLPGWLTFNAATETFTGTAPTTSPTLPITVAATDTNGLSVSETFFLAVIGAPTIGAQTPNQVWTRAKPVMLVLLPNTFIDPQGQTLTYKATQTDGTALPDWLTFNAATDTFTGTAPDSQQALGVTVTATDTSNLSATETFAVAVIGAPVATAATSNPIWIEGKAMTLALPVNTFIDPQSQTLTYAARLAGGGALPNWLTFNTTTDTFSGTAPTTYQILNIVVTATNAGGLSASESFSAAIMATPVLRKQTANQTWTAGRAVSLALPNAAFTDPQSQALTYTAILLSGARLPNWLTFNAATESFSGTAPTSAQNLAVTVTATDASGLFVSETIPIAILPPPVATTTPPQSWLGGRAVSLALPKNTFTDPQGQALSYKATLSGGAPLPAWLIFTAATDTFSGTAPTTAAKLNITVTATDTSGLSASETFAATIIGTPTVAAATTTSQTWTGGKTVSLALSKTIFTDPQGQMLTYAAAQSNGTALPKWLTFNAVNETFSGTAPTTAQTMNIKVTATDTSGLSASETFAATIIGTPTVTAATTTSQTWIGGKAVSLALPKNTFTDPQNQTLTYKATLSGGAALPNWLHFTAATDTFTGTPPTAAQTLNITVTATDTSGLSTSDTFAATIIGTPTVTAITASQTWTGGKAVSLALPKNTFTDPQNQTLTYKATLSGGAALPSWLHFTAATDTFTGTPPTAAPTLNITVTATDTSGLSASDSFAATITPAASGASVVQVARITASASPPNQTWTDGQANTFVLPGNAFADALGLKMTFAAYEAAGPNVSSWLHFNPATAAFTGTPPAGASGAVQIAVVATDAASASAADLFTLTYAPAGSTVTSTSHTGFLTTIDPAHIAGLIMLHG